MKLIERVLFYPAALAGTVFVLKLVYEQPSGATYGALAALTVFWALVFFKMMFRIVRLAFWLTVVVAGAVIIWLKV